MKIMISVISKEEALIAYESKAQLIDIKNPLEGSLGAQSPEVIRSIVDSLLGNVEISATVGDVPYLPCTVAQAAYAVASFGVDYVKLGLKGCKTKEEVRNMVSEITNAVKAFKKTNIIIGCYADYREAKLLSPFEIIEAIGEFPVKGMLIDTLSKDGRNLFDFMSKQELGEFVKIAHEKNLLCALAGSIKLEHIKELKDLQVDITGVRGAICDGGRMAKLVPIEIEKFVQSISE